MNRKQFIESQGATCNNWTWSWSFINRNDKVIIFGAWDIHTDGNTSLILSEDWQTSRKGRNQPGYDQAREHIRLVEEQGYRLATFPMEYAEGNEDEIGPAKIGNFTPKLTFRSLQKVGGCWYASDNTINNLLPEEIASPNKYYEGSSTNISVNIYERNTQARALCIKHFGCICAICSFDFEKFYGKIGENYIHVHHKIPLSEIKKEYELDPLKDLIPVCPNCHAIIHRTHPALSVEQLRMHLDKIRIK